MKKIVCLIVVLALAASVNAASYTNTAPTAGNVGQGVLWDLGAATNNTKTSQWYTTTHTIVGQNFVPANSFTLDKIEVQRGTPSSGLILTVPSDAAAGNYTVTIWQYTGSSLATEADKYLGATPGTYNWTLKATFTDSFTSALSTAMGDYTNTTNGWVVMDVPDTLNLAAGTQYAYKLDWTAVVTGNQKMIWRRGTGTGIGTVNETNKMTYISGTTYTAYTDQTGSYAIIATPEPATLALLGLGGLLLRRRK